jgi:hypothetical protein
LFYKIALKNKQGKIPSDKNTMSTEKEEAHYITAKI